MSVCAKRPSTAEQSWDAHAQGSLTLLNGALQGGESLALGIHWRLTPAPEPRRDDSEPKETPTITSVSFPKHNSPSCSSDAYSSLAFHCHQHRTPPTSSPTSRFTATAVHQPWPTDPKD